MRFSLGELDVAEKVGVGYFFVFGDGVLGEKEDGIGPLNEFGGETGFTPTCAKRKNSFAAEISRVAFSGPDRRVWREDLAPVMVLITSEAVETTGRG